MSVRWQGICLWAAVVLVHAPGVFAQNNTVNPEDEYRKAIRVSEDIQPLGENPFGEQISLYTGGLSFKQTDVSLAGQGPVLELSRQFQLEGAKSFLVTIPEHAFGDWEIDLPRIETLTANAGTLTSWQTSGTGSDTEYRNRRCSNFVAPPPVSFPGDSARDPWTPSEWWNGYHLIAPGAGDQELLPRADGNTLSPSMTGKTFSIVTKSHWQLSCLAQTSSGEPGEAFFAVAPDGTKYWFDYLVYRADTTVDKGLRSGVGPDFAVASGGVGPMAVPINLLQRRKAWMLVTRIEDRFGNALTYNYSSGRLASIEATDGRKLTVQYQSGSPRIASVILQPSSGAPRTWTYQYGGTDTYRPRLTGVVLPDSSTWAFDLAGLASAKVDLETGTAGSCYVPSVPGNLTSVYSGTITHPSGLVGTFKVQPLPHGRSGVPRDCWGVQVSPTVDGYAITPSLWYALNLIEKKFTGAGLDPQTWTYQYSAPHNSWSVDCAVATACTSTVTTSVTDPAGKAVRYTFSNFYDYTESLLQKTEFFSGAVGSSVARTEVNQYAAPATGPWPLKIGYNLQYGKQSEGQATQLFPQNKRVITQDGNTYTWQATAFDAYAQVTKTERVSNVPGQTTALKDQTTYLNDLPHWVLGLPTEIKNLNNNEVVDKYVYDLGKVTLKERWHFGQKLMSYTFDSAGQLATFTDGNSHTTTLSNYKRGIPQTIKTPDNKTQTLVVDDFGQVASITDQAGSKTSYTYDAVGRLTGISYPTGDEQSWLPRTFAYAWVTGAERGVAAKHWRRTVSQGNARTVTYFDALLRPVLSDSYINGASGSNATTLTNYDAKGQTVFASYPSATALNFTTTPGSIKGTTNTYDALGRLTQTQQGSELGALTTTTAYAAGATRKVTDPKGYVTTTTYQVFDQPSYGAVIKIVAPAGITQTVTRDLYGHPLAINQSGTYGTQNLSVDKTLIYDSYHRLCRTTEPESGNIVMAYDAANNLAWDAAGLTVTGTGCKQEQVVDGAKATRTYDAMNRLLTVLPPTGTQSTSYTYDALGNLTTAVSGTSTWSATYNKRGMLTGESLLLVGQDPWTISYVHDNYGHLSQLQYPDGENVSYAPDALGRPTRVGGYLTGIGYFPNGEMSQAILGNGASYVADQNDRQLLSNFSYGKGSTVNLSEDITYDKNGNITKFNDLTDGTRTKTFAYDDLNRLTSATATALWGTETYAYDPINNLRKRVNGSQTTTYNYDSRNRLGSLTGTGATTFGYDERGNVTSKGGVTLSFDAKNQLAQIQGYGNYAYDAAGRRVMKTPAGGGTPTYYFYNQAGQLLYQLATGTAQATNLIYLGRKLVARNANLHLMAPAAVSFSANPNDGSYTVSWSAVPGATSYTLQERPDGGSWTTVYTGSATSKALSGRAGGSYTYQVRGCVGSTCGGWRISGTLGVRPVLPVITVPTGTINGTYTVSWTAPASATGYDVQERLGSGSWAAIASNLSATSISLSERSSGSYTYRVSAKNSYGTRGWATSDAVTVDTDYGVLPDVPASLTVPATSSTGSVSLSWSAVDPVPRYVVEQSSNGGTSWSSVYDGSATSKALSGLANGNYSFRVQACNTYGCSAWKAGSATLVVTRPPASAPTVTTPASNTTGSYTVSWGAVSTATSYTLQEKVGTGNWTTIQTASATSKAISGKGNGSYGYQVQACNAGGCSAWSGTQTTTVLLKPATPASITVPSTSSGSIAVSWASSATATSYTLQQRLGTGSWSSVYTGSGTSSTRTVTGSGSYTYQVQACNASGCSAYKASSAVTVTIPPASAPTLTVPTTSSTGSYTASWTAVTGATSYTLQEKVGSGSWAAAYTGSAKSKAISGKGNGSYGYRVQACNAGGCGAWSSTKTITVTLIPVAPGSPTVSITGPSYKPVVHVSWSAVTGATSYQVEGNHPQEGVATYYNGPNTTFSQLIFATGQMTFRVKACNTVGCSGWSGYGYVNLNSGNGDPLLKEPGDPVTEGIPDDTEESTP